MPATIPGHLLVTRPDAELTASPGGSGSRITLHRTSVGDGSSEPVVEYRPGPKGESPTNRLRQVGQRYVQEPVCAERSEFDLDGRCGSPKARQHGRGLQTRDHRRPQTW
ncbi:hypothetical protein M2163_000948 [Streptomyces sp. SAI-135]|uniref:hypothetical protein n=1 Tax=unclassified Streptomyces TaxID=2593676 RepID=UPI0024744347|nr:MULTISPECIES: hypothetical protein [unclassified Streptomyces]MDH6522542.1 hypothetical protein [Streptomyces sp. SAI-090]MDH6554166.1 hypothetical protein [Streptomyces sp. SAI-041]MDH6573427.1 hypothetical protein [Streptomyces sp. SAI-117]MDH6613840.1 hypothetical protein [Streptomyces sp. SAI-135]